MIGLFTGLVTWALSSFISRILIGAGLSIATFGGLQLAIDSALSSITSNFNGLPVAAAQIIYMAGVGVAISILGAAVLTSVAFTSAKVFLTKT